jgi:predicted nucleic acid-binding protein
VGIEGISVVADAGPLLHLAEIDCLFLLNQFEQLHIPEAVEREIQRQGLIFWPDISGRPNLQRHTLSQTDVLFFIKTNHLEELHVGERECLYLCQHIGILVLLTDDLAVRDAAKGLHLTPVGSLGVVVRAYRMGQISLSEAEHDLTKLYDVSSLFVTKAIVDLAMEQLH